MLKKINPYKFITYGFLFSIIIGGFLLWLPISLKEGVEISLLDSYFITISSICVTGLSTVDVANTFNIFGVSVIAILIQIGGLGVVCAGLSIILLAGSKIGIKERILIKESLNVNTLKGIVKLVLSIFKITFIIELIGSVVVFFGFKKYYDFKNAIIISIFHSISSFNNAGFDLIGNYKNLTPFKNDFIINFATSFLIILGGLGFLVIKDVIEKKSFIKLTLHSKIVITTTLILIFVGTFLIWITQDISLIGAYFASVTTRTAGFNTYDYSLFNNVGLIILMILMFIGASPSSTGGGIKTTSLYIMIKGTLSICSNKKCHSFKRYITLETINKAYIILFLGILVVLFSTFGLCLFEKDISFINLLFESISAFATVGLSNGVTPQLCSISKIIIMITMFIGRVGALTLISTWSKKGKTNVQYPEENIMIG